MRRTVRANLASGGHFKCQPGLVFAQCPVCRFCRATQDGFTLLELLVVTVVVAVLCGLLLPVLSKAREAGKSTACLSNLRQSGFALQLYVQDNNNRLPFMRDRLLKEANEGPLSSTNLPGPETVLSNYLGNRAVLQCPSDKAIFKKTQSSYAWNSLLNGQNADRLEMFGMSFNPHQVPVMFDKEKFHAARGPGKGQNFLFADGHLKNLLVLEGGTLSFP